jgi:hypothetical protein
MMNNEEKSSVPLELSPHSPRGDEEYKAPMCTTTCYEDFASPIRNNKANVIKDLNNLLDLKSLRS